MKTSKNKIIWIGIALIVLVLTLGLIAPGIQKLMLPKEDRVALKYHQFTDDDKKVEGCDNVEFLAYFTRDLNKDGIAEKLAGTTLDMSSSDVLYLELNVISDGTLEDGKITFSSGNNYKVELKNLLKDGFFAQNYINVTDANEIMLDTVNAGTQRLVVTSINSNVDKNGTNFTKDSKVTLTGTHVSSDGSVRTPITKEITLTVDWHGKVSAYIDAPSQTIYRAITQTDEEYNTEDYGLSTLPEYTASPFTVQIKTGDSKGQLPITGTTTTVKVPNLKGYAPEWVNVSGGTYDEEHRLITYTNNSSSISYKNTNSFEIKYPLDAYKACFYAANGTIQEDAMAEVLFEVNTSYTGKNNENYENPYTSTAKTNLSVIVNMDRGGQKPKELMLAGVDFHEDLYERNGYFDGNKLLNAYNDPDRKYFYYVVDYTVNNAKSVDEAVSLYDIQSDKLGPYDLTAYETNCFYYVNKFNFKSALGKDGYIDAYGITYTGSSLTTENLDEATYQHAGKLEYGKKGNVELKRDSTYTKVYLEGAFGKEFTDDVFSDLQESEWDYIVTGSGFGNIQVGNLHEMEADYDAPTWVKFTTSPIKAHSVLTVSIVKRVDLDLLRNSISENNIKTAGTLSSYLSNTQGANIKVAFAKSGANIGWSEYDTKFETQNVDNPVINKSFRITTDRGDGLLKTNWKDGEFVVVLPQEFIDVDIKSVTGDNVTITGYTLNKDRRNNRYYLKILTENNTPVISETITVNADVIPDARSKSKTASLELYYYNGYCNEYNDTAMDIYDANNNGNTEDRVGYAKCGTPIVASETLITVQTVSDYDEFGSITVAPNSAELSKDTRSANINISVTNNYHALVTGTKLLGRVPYEGNKYVLTDRSMGSDFTAAMTGPIVVPNTIKDKTTVYYSEVGEPGKDITVSANGWKTADEVTNWALIKSYLIDMSEVELSSGYSYEFSYPVTIPTGLDYNDSSYATHAVEYDYNSPNGTIHLETEPTKVGLKITRLYNLTGIKLKEGKDLRIKGAIYELEELNSVGDVVKKTALISDSNGNFSAQGVYVNATYRIREISAPQDYLLNNKVYEFRVKEKTDGSLEFEYISENHFRAEAIQIDAENNDIAYIEIEDEPKYQLNVTYVDKNTRNPIPSVVVRIGSDTKSTNSEGKVSFERLLPGEDYELQEILIKGNITENYEFKLDRSGDTYIATLDDGMEFDDPSIVNDSVNHLVQLNVVIEKEANPTYTLEIVKVEKDAGKKALADMKKIPGAVFTLENNEDGELGDFTTDANGVITVTNLYQYVEGRPISGRYSITEKTAPEGYIINGEEVAFVVTTEDNELKVDFEDRANLTSIKDAIIDGNKVTIVIQDLPYFRLLKTDSETGAPLANAKFIIYEVDENGNIIDCAKDIHGNYVGTQDPGAKVDDPYYVYTNEEGIISLPLRDGKYQIEEVEAPAGYSGESVQTFEIKNNPDPANANVNTDTPYVANNANIDEFVAPVVAEEDTIEINYIEDLIDLGIQIANDNTYEGKKVVLKRDLDITDRDSYRNPDDMTTYGDYDEDEETKTIFEEVNGPKGLKPLGRRVYEYEVSGTQYSNWKYDKVFSGIFDGNNHEINLVSTSSWACYGGNMNGLFANISDATIMNLGITGDMVGQGSISAYFTNGFTLYNCYNKANISSDGNIYEIGGLVGKDSNNNGESSSEPGHTIRIEKCYNEGTITCSGYASGLIGYMSYSGRYDYRRTESFIIKDCYNKGTLNSNSSSGISSYVYLNKIYKNFIVYNFTNEAAASAGLFREIGFNSGNTASDTFNMVFENCTNKGNINAGYTAGGLIGQVNLGNNKAVSKISFINCVNESTQNLASTTNHGGIVTQLTTDKNNTSVEFVNCKNKSNISSSSSYYVGGIVGYINGVKDLDLINCVNEGEMSTTYSSPYIAGMVGYLNSPNGNINMIDCKQLGDLKGVSSGGIYYIQSGTAYLTVKNFEIENAVNLTGPYASGVIGLFDCTGTITIEDCHLNIPNIQGSYVGGILGYANSSTQRVTVKNCSFEGNLETTNYSGYVAGGIIGYSCGLVQIDDCTFKGNLKAGYGGGIIGEIYGSGTYAERPHIKNCHSDAHLTTNGYYLGGILGYGYNTLDIENCYFKGYIDGEYQGAKVGGIAGASGKANIRNCVNYGSINVTRATYVGGITGGNDYGSSGTDTDCNIENVYNYGDIVVLNGQSSYIGGIVGYGYSLKIRDSFNKGDIFVNIASYATGITGNGGKLIERCYNEGDIIALNPSSTNVYAAGISIYMDYNATVKNCYNTGTIISDGKAGGITATTSNLENSGNCYNVGDVISNNDAEVGAITCYTYINLDNTYCADNIALGSSKANTHSATTVDYDYMKTTEFYNKLNKDKVWIQKPGKLPTFAFKMPVFGEATELNVTNDKDDYMIKTKALPGGTISGSSETPYETVEAGADNTKIIEAEPSEGYKLTNLLVNGRNIALESDESSNISYSAGKLTLSPGYFRNMSENKFITAVFSNNNVYEFTKVDEDDNSIKLTGAQFKVSQYDKDDYDSKFGELTNIDGQYGFTENDGVYTSTNQGVPNSVALMYMPIDLTNYTDYTEIKFEYNTVEYSVAPFRGFWWASETFEVPQAPYSQYNTFCGSGIWNSITLEGGKQYYLFFGYYKDETEITENDQLTIKISDISLSGQFEGILNFDDTSKTQFTTSLNKIYLKETKAPEGYDLDPVTHEYVYDSENPSYIITNKKTVPAEVVVHHYLMENGVKTLNKVAEDEKLYGAIGDGYITAPLDLDGLEVDVNEVPLNAIGDYAAEPTEVNYYYNVKSVDLTIHHYEEGTTTSVANDETISVKPEITLDAVNSTYTLAPLTYVLKDNASYNTLVAGSYKLSDVYSDIQNDLTIDSTLSYSEDAELTYTYIEKIFDITTRVKKHIETSINELTNEEVKEEVAGGTISGQDLAVYEKVSSGEDATKDIVITANDGYLIKDVKITSKAEDGTETTKVLYGENAEDCEITYSGDTKTITLTRFEDLSENKVVTVEFMPQATRALVHHIIQGQTEDYRTETITGNVGKYYTTSPIEITGYEFVSSTLNTTGYLTEEVINVNYYYGPVDCVINIRYEDINSGALLDQDTVDGKFGNSITLADYAKDIANYTLRESPAEETATFAVDAQTFIFKYAKNASVRAIYVKQGTTEKLDTDYTEEGYEGKAYTTSAKTIAKYDLVATPLNAEGTMAVTDTSSETLVTYEYVKKNAKVVVKYIDINSNEVVTSSEINGKVDDTYTVTPTVPNGYVLMEENAQGESILPTNTNGPMTEETIEVKYYVAKEASVRAIYVKQGTTEKLDTDYTEEGYEGKAYTTSAKVVAKYDLVATPANAEGTMAVTDTSSETLVTYEYVKKNAKVVVKYIDINSNEVVTSSEINGKVDDTYTVTAEIPNGYVLMEENAQGESILPTNITGPMTEETIEVKYYVAKEASVRAIYVKQGTTEKLDTDYTEEGYEGKAYRTSAKVVAKYDLVATPANAEGTMAVTDTSSETLVTYEYVKKNAKVVVKYIDINSNEVVDTDEINGKVDDTYTVTPTVPNGYVLMEENAQGESILPTNTTGPMTESTIEVKYYVAKEASVRAIYVKQGTTDKIDTDYTEEGYEGKAYRTSAKVVAKYDLVATPANAEGTMAVTDTSSETLVTYEYVKKNAKVVVKYIDINSNEVVTSSEINGKVDDTYTVTAEIPNGYVLMEENAQGESILPTNITGPMTEETIEVKYYVAKEASVRAIYVKQGTTEKLDTDYTEEGYEGKAYRTSAKVVANYELVATPANAEGTMAVTDTSSETLVTYEYKEILPDPTKVIVKYIDINSNEIVTSNEISGRVGTTYTVTPEVPNGYVLMEENAQGESILPTNTSNIMTLQPIEVVYYVAKEASVRAIYVKQGTTEKLDTDYTEEGYEGKAYRTTAKEINGYELVSMPINAEGTMAVTDTSSETLVTYEYKLIPQEPDDAKVIVKYIDVNTNEAVTSKEINGKVGDPYTVTPEVPEGYVLIEKNAEGESILPTNTSDVMTLQPIEVVYYVAKEASVRAVYVKQGTTEKLDTDYVEEGYEGKAYTTTAKEINGYNLVATPLNAEGTMAVTDASSETLVTYEYKVPEPDDAKVIVKYIDVNTNEAVTSKEINGKVGDPYTVTPEVPEGYVLIEKNAEGESILPTNTSDVMTKEIIEVTYYVAREANVRAIYVKQGTTDKISEDVVIEGYEGKEYTTSAKTVEGYTLVSNPTNATGTMKVTDTSKETIVTYEYKANESKEPKETKVIAKYVDINTKKPIHSKTIIGKVGDPYNVTPVVPEGYTLIEKDEKGESLLPTNAKGTMTESPIEVVYYVAKDAQVIVSYVKEGTDTVLADNIAIIGYEGEEFTTHERNIPGYIFSKVDGITSGKMKSGIQKVIYSYIEESKKEAAKVKVIYIDTDTKKEIAESTIINGYDGDPYTTSAKTIKDYEILVIPTNAKGTMKATEDGEEIVVKYIYKKNSAAKVVEKYVDINTQEVVESIDHEGKIGKSYEIKPNVPDGYQLQEKDSKGMNILPIRTKGVMTEKPIEVVFYVAKDAKVTAYYVVKYEDDELADRVVIEGYEGKEYAVDSKDIDGYELIEIDGNQEGLMAAGENIVTFYYAKKATGIIPQTGIHTLEYLVGTILVIFILNSGIRVVYKYKCRKTEKTKEDEEETEAKSEEKDNK